MLSLPWIFRILAVLGLCLVLSACGGGSDSDNPDEITTPEDPEVPEEPEPVEPTDVGLGNLNTYIDTAKALWGDPGGRGLYEIVEDLKSEDNTVRYSYVRYRAEFCRQPLTPTSLRSL